MTPNLLLARKLISVLQIAVLRGVEVNIILPARNNLPFVHIKLFVVDDHYAQIRSATMDPRSLHLNFELIIEIYEEDVVKALSPHVQAVASALKR